MKKVFFCLLIGCSFIFGSVSNAIVSKKINQKNNHDVLVINNKGEQIYKKIIQALLEKEDNRICVVDYLLEKEFLKKNVSLAAGYFLIKIQESLSEKSPVFVLENFSDEKKDVMNEIIFHFYCVELIKSEVNSSDKSDDEIKEINNAIEYLVNIYLEEDFFVDYINYSSLI